MDAIPVPSPRAKVFFLTTPNSPYGSAFSPAWTERLLSRFRGIVVADEAYVDFGAMSAVSLLSRCPRLLVVRTLSKSYSLAGMRAGLLFGSEPLVRELMKVKDSYNVSRPAQAAAHAALADEAYFRATRDAVVAGRERFAAAIVAHGYRVLPSFANFVFVIPPRGLAAKTLYERLLARGFLVRHLGGPAVSDGLRISIGNDPDMAALAGIMAEEADGR